jgi:hypothetical protein
MNMTFPIIIIEGQDVGIFSSIKDAQNQLEVVDVGHGAYTAYDAEGRLLQLSTKNNRVVISVAEKEPMHAEILKSALRVYLKEKSRLTDDDLSDDLPFLVENCLKLEKDHWPMVIKLKQKIKELFKHLKMLFG